MTGLVLQGHIYRLISRVLLHKKINLPLLDLNSIHLLTINKKITLASLSFFAFYLFVFFLFIIQLTKCKAIKRPLTLACSTLFLFYLFSFYLLYNLNNNLACTVLSYNWDLL